MKKKRDSQVSAVYAWERTIERTFELRTTLTLEECKQMVSRLWRMYSPNGTKPPNVFDGRARRSACYQRFGHAIKLPVSLRRPMVVIHETAHGLLRKASIAPHGREFARLVFDMYCKEFKISLGQVRSLGMYQQPRRVKFSTIRQMKIALQA